MQTSQGMVTYSVNLNLCQGHNRDYMNPSPFLHTRSRHSLTLGISVPNCHQETIQRLGTEFENQLKDIVKHCSESGQNTIHTPSDFGARDLSINDFDEIMNMLDQ